jgi:hypothetical protein
MKHSVYKEKKMKDYRIDLGNSSKGEIGAVIRVTAPNKKVARKMLLDQLGRYHYQLHLKIDDLDVSVYFGPDSLMATSCYDPRHEEPCQHPMGSECQVCSELCDPRFLLPHLVVEEERTNCRTSTLSASRLIVLMNLKRSHEV